MHRGKGMKFVGDSRIPVSNKKHIPKDYSEYPGKTEAFWPNFLLKEWLVGSVFLVAFLCLTAAHPSPLEKIADPTASGYIPLPDWYFLFMYQLIKYTYASGDFNVIGTLVIPGLAFGALLLAPFLDRGPERRPSKRPVATGMMLLAFASVAYLTWESASQVDWEARAESAKIVAGADIDKESEGYLIYQAQSCIGCHGADLEGGPAGKALVDNGHTPEEIADIAVNGTGNMPANAFKGTDEELQKLAEFISSVTSK